MEVLDADIPLEDLIKICNVIYIAVSLVGYPRTLNNF